MTRHPNGYKTKLMQMVHDNAKAIFDLDWAKPYYDLKEGRAPMPEYIATFAAQNKRDQVSVLDDAIKYRQSFAFQQNKLTYAKESA